MTSTTDAQTGLGRARLLADHADEYEDADEHGAGEAALADQDGARGEA